MSAPSDALIEWILWIAGISLALYVCLPHLLQSLGLDFYRNAVYGTPSQLEADALDGSLDAVLHRQLQELGFAPLGIFQERILWHKGGHFVYLNAKEKCLATLCQLFGGEARVMFKTIFENGAVVVTSNYSIETAERHTDDYIRKCVPTNLLAHALQEHRRSVTIFHGVGERERTIGILEDVRDAESAFFFNRSVRLFYRANNWNIFLAHVLVLSVATVILILPLRFMAPMFSFPLALIGAALGYLTLIKYLVWQATRNMSLEQQQADAVPNGDVVP